ncbi:spermidine/putrescine ABC transporter substrate-binding protein [Clostridia bacterium]|nr:spermidine/putrescine ABC transporter substrate-binding protein [Clostridia bacterium]
MKIFRIKKNLTKENTSCALAKPSQAANSGNRSRRMVMLSLIALLLLGMSVFSACGTPKESITVLNYGKYLDPKVLKLFEKETGIHVNYEEYITPENMYTKYKAGSIDYDLICTSDYMVEKLIEEGEVNTLDFNNIPLYSNIDPMYLDYSKSFDPDNTYSIPYFVGTVGLLYNKTMVDVADIDSWACLFDPKYEGKIIMSDSVRDSFMAALKYKGDSLNTTNMIQLSEAQHLLKEQKPLVYSYLVDEASDEMIAENAAIALVYSGEAAVAISSNDKLAYSVPKEGSNLWIDSWFMPKTCQHTENADKFLDFLCREDIAKMNFDYVFYETPNKAVYDNLPKDVKENETIFPPKSVLDNCEVYKSLPPDATTEYNELWKGVKAE